MREFHLPLKGGGRRVSAGWGSRGDIGLGCGPQARCVRVFSASFDRGAGPPPAMLRAPTSPFQGEVTRRNHYVGLMRTDLFDFDLPPERIALRPASPRDSARMLVVRPGETF